MSAEAEYSRLHIVSDTPHLLVAEQQPEARFPLLVLLAISFVLLFFVRKLWRARSRPGVVIFSGLAIILPSLYFILPQGLERKIFLDRTAGTIQWTEERDNKLLATHRVAASDLLSVEMESDRMGRRVVLIYKNNTEAYPLGQDYVPSEDAQYPVLYAIRDLIQQAGRSSDQSR